MKVVLVAGAHPKAWPADLVQQADVLIGIDRGTWYLLQAGHLPDIAVGDFDSLSAEELASVKAKVAQVHQLVPEKDDTDTQIALKIAVENYPTADFYLLGATGGRVDHFLANLFLPFEARFAPFTRQIHLLDQQNQIDFYLPGSYTVTKNPAYFYLAYVPLTPVQQLKIWNSKYALPATDLPIPYAYASNEFIGSTANFSFASGLVAVIQSKDQTR
ncbi:thiamine diphosphokinase [Enterococcus nangangensis]|uniref:thiamine diphosphokinase n=1 Tax=Enterococcus nangangensis TaxID=2559926 RepID=UPI0010F8C605|nr:thiamine diphosphokinase [Enterococcus nangangensis]